MVFPSLLPRAVWLFVTIALFLSVDLDAESKRSAPAPVDLVGLGRADVIALLGKPTGERQKGDVVVMVYADGKRIELRGGTVVAVSGGSAGEIVGSDGVRYVPGADGNIKRPVTVIEPAAGADPAELPRADGTDGAAPVSAAAETPPPAAEAVDELPPGAVPVLPPGFATEAIEKHIIDMEEPQEPEPESLAKVALVFALSNVLRFGFTVLVLRLAVHVVGVPFFWPDLLKVAVLYLAVHGSLEGLGGLGGWWEFIPVFRLDDAVSFLILACGLTWFKVAGSGLTALKIAAATKFVVVGLMLAAGLAITFGLSAMS